MQMETAATFDAVIILHNCVATGDAAVPYQLGNEHGRAGGEYPTPYTVSHATSE